MESKGDITSAAAKVEGVLTRTNLSKLKQAVFPAAMQSEALQVVDEIVTPGDGGEEVVDLGGALFAGRIEDVAHADILAQ